MSDTTPVGSTVEYAGGLYRVASVNAGILTLDGVANSRHVMRPRCTVLASDVIVVVEVAHADQ